jgi:hypothetical protein
MYSTARRIRKTAFVLLTLATTWVVQAQTPEPDLLLDRKAGEGPTLVVLGTGHFANPGRDLVNIRMEDVLAEKRQKQIQDVVNELAAFRPTFVAVEWPEAKQAELDTLYSEYRGRRHTLGASELQQLGLRLADKLNLPRVHAVDWNGMPPGEMKAYDYPAWAEANGQNATLQTIVGRITASSVRLGPDESIAGWLLRMNASQALLRDHRAYFDIAMLADSDSQPGAAWVGTWYARNLRIFRNLTRLTSKPQDRILVIYGAGHAYLLRQFAAESNAFRLVDVDQVLKGH